MTQLPTEMQVLTGRMNQEAATLTANLVGLPQQIAAVMDWQLTQEQDAILRQLVYGLLLSARSMEFDASRLCVVVDEQTDDARQLYQRTVDAVDGCRFAKGAGATGACLHLAEKQESHLAAMQMVIGAWFRGENNPAEG